MKKVLLFLGVFLFLLTPSSWAEYTLKTRGDVEKALQRFFQEEQGNRLSTYSMRGLMMEINRVFTENIKPPSPPEKAKEPK